MRASKRRSHRAIRAEVFREYCESSSIHGVRYFDRAERTPCERFWWIVMFLLSMVGCGIMIYKAYVKWNQAPIIVSFSERTTPVWDIQFPAITICPETKVPSSKLNFTAEMNALMEGDPFLNRTDTNTDSMLIGVLKVVAQLCNFLFHANNILLPFVNGDGENDVVNVLRNVSLKRDQVVIVCYYDNEFSYCDDHLTETVTEEGLCYSFNMMSEDDIFRKESLHAEYRYTQNWIDWRDYEEDNHSTEPLYARGAGMHAGLVLYLLQSKEDMDYMCTGFSQGYKLMVHDPSVYPQVAKRHIRLPLSHEISVALKPQMMVTSQSAADYGWDKRQCFFNHERRLRFFKIYNQDNCELECLTNLTLAMCGCVRFSMPRANGTIVCPLHRWDCMYRVRSHFRQNRNVSYDDRDDGEDRFSMCNCLPACSSVHYDVEITQSTLDVEKFLRANKINDKRMDNQVVTTLEIYFKESHFITSKRSELYGLVDFLANCGGLLGLFMGVSILSLLEICYFITIRPFSVRKKLFGSKQRKITEANNTLLAVVYKNE